ncbi:ScbR family autoregulator-binding transcription factor [Microbacterium gorillae]|uniref:ScbR family autoregulator-binding transcription factor n=1 Tax=Microbacterium gorillae TaxID=1231063 RepID=UPI003D9835F0
MVERRAASLKQQRSIETREALLSGAARVFSDLSYSGTRLRTIANESGISEGAMYFHFGTKAELANAVLAEQQERMTEVLASMQEEEGDALEKLVLLMNRLAVLISTDRIVQGGIRLAADPNVEITADARDPYFEWIAIAQSLIEEGVRDGSIRADVVPAAAAEYANALFVGAQVLSGLEDGWVSFPSRIDRLTPFLRRELGD